MAAALAAVVAAAAVQVAVSNLASSFAGQYSKAVVHNFIHTDRDEHQQVEPTVFGNPGFTIRSLQPSQPSTSRRKSQTILSAGRHN